ncbi:30S ribosomal protein S8 [Glycocaulis sp.]|uniref:30S ribosomal protein S8 n=1 Tax=Glycocaulis sp. TaxID=1969725 RepID=UPI003D217CEB
MSMIDPLGDMLTRIRNALMRRRTSVVTPASKLRQRVLDVLLEEGYIRGYSESLDADGFKQFEIELKYYEGAPVISEIKRVSKPGRREYSKARDLPLVQNGLGIAIVSTPRGVMSDASARAQNVGGEILCHIS